MSDPSAAPTLAILLLGGAKRVSVARMLKQAARARGVEACLYSYELGPRMPIAREATVITGLRWADPAVSAHIHAAAASHGVRCIIPFVDPAVGIASRLALQDPALFVPVSPPGVCDAMFDKIVADDIFEQQGLPRPRRYRRGRPDFPLIAKPHTGSASKGIRIIDTVSDFREVVAPDSGYLLQEYVADRTEYTVDCYVSRQGRVCCVSPRVRLETVGGEVTRTVTIDSPEVVDVATRVLKRVGLRGAVTVQLLRSKADGRLMVMEVNPRLGGGVVCSVHAGADIPGMIIDEALGREPQPCPGVAPGVEIARYFQEVPFGKP